MCRRLAHLSHFSRDCDFQYYMDGYYHCIEFVWKTTFSHGSHVRTHTHTQTFIHVKTLFYLFEADRVSHNQYIECDLTTLFSIVYFDNVFLSLPFISRFCCRSAAVVIVVVRAVVAVAAIIVPDDVVAFHFSMSKS